MRNRIIIPWIISMMIVLPCKAQWTDVSVPTSVQLTHGAFTDDVHGFVSSSTYNTLWRTANGGVTWDSTTFIETVYDVDFSDALNGVVLLHGNGNYKLKTTNDGGNTWNYMNWTGGPFESFNGIITTGPSNYFISSYNYILKTNDGGIIWDTILFGGYPYSMDKEKINQDTILFTGWDGTFMYEGQVTRSYDGGNTWTFQSTGDDYTNFDGSYFINGMHGYGVYHRGWGPDTAVVSYTSDGGNTWNEIYFDTTIVFHDVFMKSATEGYIAATEGTTGKIQHTTDGVNYFDDFTSPNPVQRLYHVSNTLYAIGSNGLVVKKSVSLGISDNEISTMEFYPNPASDYIQLQNEGNMHFSMIDVNGKVVLEKTVQPREKINLNGISDGIYLLQLENGKNIVRGKIVIGK